MVRNVIEENIIPMKLLSTCIVVTEKNDFNYIYSASIVISVMIYCDNYGLK